MDTRKKEANKYPVEVVVSREKTKYEDDRSAKTPIGGPCIGPA